MIKKLILLQLVSVSIKELHLFTWFYQFIEYSKEATELYHWIRRGTKNWQLLLSDGQINVISIMTVTTVAESVSATSKVKLFVII